MAVVDSSGFNPDGSPMTPEEEAKLKEFLNTGNLAEGGYDATNTTDRASPTNTSLMEDRKTEKSNSRWLMQTFSISRSYNAALRKTARTYDASEFKFYDTTPGGYRAINPAPQFTRYADIKRRNRNTNSRGLGRYYSEAIDDSAQIIHIRAGTAEPNSLTGFLARAYEPSAAKLARTGEGSSFLASATELVGNVLLLPFVPFIQGWASLKQLLSEAPNNKFYYSKPAMALYYNAVNMMLIKIAVDMGIIGGGRPTADKPEPVSTQGAVPEKETYNSAFKVEPMVSEDDRRALHAMFPDIFDVEYGFDIRAISTRYQRLANKNHEIEKKIMDEAKTIEGFRRSLTEHYQGELTDSGDKSYLGPHLQAYLGTTMATGTKSEQVVSADIASLEGKDEEIKSKIEEAYVSTQDNRSDYGEWWKASYEFLKAEFNEGSQWVSIRVEHTGTVSASFNNQSEESGLATSINSASAKAQSTKLNFANGNIGDDVFSDFAETIFGAVTDVVGQAGSAIGVGAVGAMLGGGRLDIPKYWSDSSATLPGGSYSVKLRAISGNKIAIFKDIFIPQAMITCLALPKAAGPSAYTSPFTLEIFDPGRWQSSLALMESLNIERGTGNLGWSKAGYPLGVDIDFEIVDLSTIVPMAITGQSFSFNDRSSYSDYLAALANKNPLDQLTVSGRFNSKKKQLTAQAYSTFNAANLASTVADSWAGRMIRATSRSTATLTGN